MPENMNNENVRGVEMMSKKEFVKKTLKLLKGICAAKKKELQSYEEAWPNPTAKQKKRIDIARKELHEAIAKRRAFVEIVSHFPH